MDPGPYSNAQSNLLLEIDFRTLSDDQLMKLRDGAAKTLRKRQQVRQLLQEAYTPGDFLISSSGAYYTVQPEPEEDLSSRIIVDYE